MRVRGVALAVSGPRVHHSPEMVPAEQTLSPGAVASELSQHSPGSAGGNSDHALLPLPVTDCARKLLVLFFFIHAARQVSECTDSAQESKLL